jgi:hypothetical protein
MARNSRLGLTRDQLAVFLNDHEQIRQFEKLFDTVDAGSSDNAIVDVQIIAQLASNTANQAVDTNHLKTDYIDFNQSPPHSDKVARVVWNGVDNTLNLHHAGGVIQQVGQETYIYGRNNTGSTITNGSTVGFGGVTGGNRIEFVDYIADGTYPSEYFLGVATQDIAAAGLGLVTVFGAVREINTTGTPVGETWVQGGELYASPTTAGAFTNIKPTAPDLAIPVAIVMIVGATDGEIFVRPIIEQQKYYGQFSRTTDVTAAVINTAYPIDLNVTGVENGITRGTPTSRLVAEFSGLYNFSVNLQLLSNSASAKNAWFWFRKNGADIVNSASLVTLTGNNEYKSIHKSDFISLNATDYVEVVFAVDNTGLFLDATAATAFAPAAPAVLVAVTQVQQ